MGSSNQWDADWEVSDDLAHKLITSQFPQLASKSVQKLGHGWDNTVNLVGTEHVFRFSRREVAINSGLVRVLRKGNKEQYVYFSEQALIDLEIYIRVRKTR